MAAGPEKKVKRRVRDILSVYGAYAFMPATHGYGSSGVHDVVACYRGHFVSVECKADATKAPTALQNGAAKDVWAAGGVAVLIHEGNIHVLTETLDLLMSGHRPVLSEKLWPVPLA